ncbi:MAG: hypothetical protein WCP07_08900, partial [bacterium]
MLCRTVTRRVRRERTPRSPARTSDFGSKRGAKRLFGDKSASLTSASPASDARHLIRGTTLPLRKPYG